MKSRDFQRRIRGSRANKYRVGSLSKYATSTWDSIIFIYLLLRQSARSSYNGRNKSSRCYLSKRETTAIADQMSRCQKPRTDESWRGSQVSIRAGRSRRIREYDLQMFPQRSCVHGKYYSLSLGGVGSRKGWRMEGGTAPFTTA